MKTQNFKSASKNIAVFLMVVATVISGYALVKADFSGDWALDTEKSVFPAPPGGGGGAPGGGRRGDAKLKVTQTGAALTVVRTSLGRDGAEVITTDNLTADGKESVSTGGRQGAVRKVAVKWSEDQNTATITTNTTMTSQGGEAMQLPGKETWSLSADGKVLTIDSERSFQGNVMTSKLIYNKQ